MYTTGEIQRYFEGGKSDWCFYPLIIFLFIVFGCGIWKIIELIKLGWSHICIVIK